MPVIQEDARPLGVVYTPASVAGPMVRLALAPLVTGRSARELLALRVCDPAIGEGVFLLEVVAVLADHVLAAWSAGDPDAPAGPRARWPDEARRRVAASCIHGVDIDPRAVAAARAATGARPEALQRADALALDWEVAFPDVFAGRGGFDVIVANPPYIRQERLTEKAALRRFASYDGVADLYVYFVELAHQLLRPGGRYCVIVPTKWLTAAYGRPLRSYLAAQQSIEGLVDLARSALFADADAFPCIVWGTAGAPRTEPIRTARPARTDAVEAALGEAAPVQGRERWQAEPWHLDTAEDRGLLDRLQRSFPPLEALVPDRPARGVVTGCNRAFVIDRATRDRLLALEPAADALLRPFVKGRDIRGWLPACDAATSERWLVLVDRGTSLEALPAIRDHLARFRDALEPRPATWTGPGTWRGRKPGRYAWYELQDPVGALATSRTPRLLYQDIQTGPACCLDRDGALVPDTTVWMLPTADLVLLAVLNSPLYGWYARRRFPPALNGAVRPKAAYLRTLPVPRPDPATRRRIEALVEQRLELAHTRRQGATNLDRVAGELDAALARAIADAYALSADERQLITRG